MIRGLSPFNALFVTHKKQLRSSYGCRSSSLIHWMRRRGHCQVSHVADSSGWRGVVIGMGDNNFRSRPGNGAAIAAVGDFYQSGMQVGKLSSTTAVSEALVRKISQMIRGGLPCLAADMNPKLVQRVPDEHKNAMITATSGGTDVSTITLEVRASHHICQDMEHRGHGSARGCAGGRDITCTQKGT